MQISLWKSKYPKKGIPHMALQPEHWISPEEYHEIERTSEIKYEYIDGHIYAMSGGTTDHATIAGNMFTTLKAHLRGKTCRVFNSDVKVQPSESENPSYYPDITVTCNPDDYKQGSSVIRSPRFIVEVLSPSTEYKDRGRKLRDYRASPSLEEYVIISTRYQQVEIFHRTGEAWAYRQFIAGQEVTLISIDLTIPVSAIYEDTAIPEQDEI
jgi:Uma2 family endonuclease